MNELPVIGSLCLRKEFWDRHGANIVTRYKGTYGKINICEQDYGFYAAVLSYMDKDMLARGKSSQAVKVKTIQSVDYY